MLAATAVGMFASLRDAVAACVANERTLTPNASTRDLYTRSFVRYQETGQFLDRMARKWGTDPTWSSSNYKTYERVG
jgi:hypothetical protein